MDIIEELRWRDLIFQISDEAALAEALAQGPQTLYAGFDPTADSLHVGNLVPLIALRRFQLAGHRPIALVGGATGLIGDPSGKSEERVLNDADTVQLWAGRIRGQIEKIVDFSDGAALLVDNYEWISRMSTIDYLRGIGKYFSVNAMMKRESVSARLEREGDGISYTEFSYMILQALDFDELHQRHNCRIQIGGSDQWGNMVSGIDLIRRRGGPEAFVVTFPLLTTHDGKKFGKSERGAIWLDADKTSPYEFYQYWMNVDDQDVIKCLKMFTFLPQAEVNDLAAKLAERPEARDAQRALAEHMTDMIHGADTTQKVVAASQALFGRGELSEIDAPTFAGIAKSAPQAHYADLENIPELPKLLVDTGLCASTSQARQALKSGGVYLNNARASDFNYKPGADDFLHGRFLLLRRGKKHYAMCLLGEAQ